MNIGLVANDNKKELMINLCIAYKNILSKHELFATGSTGHLLESIVGLKIHSFLPGDLGGESQLCAHIEYNELDALIYLIDPANANHDNWSYSNIFLLCDAHNIPLATNLATAEILILAIDKGNLSWREIYK